MKSQKILESDISDLKISSLPTRPNSPSAFGGKGYTSIDMKEAFDKLPLFIIERLNMLIDDINGESGESISTVIKTGIYEGHTLDQMFVDMVSGGMANYFTVFGQSLTTFLGRLRTDVDAIKARLE